MVLPLLPVMPMVFSKWEFSKCFLAKICKNSMEFLVIIHVMSSYSG